MPPKYKSEETASRHSLRLNPNTSEIEESHLESLPDLSQPISNPPYTSTQKSPSKNIQEPVHIKNDLKKYIQEQIALAMASYDQKNDKLEHSLEDEKNNT